jgi:hypothetical protein
MFRLLFAMNPRLLCGKQAAGVQGQEQGDHLDGHCRETKIIAWAKAVTRK